MVDDPRAPLYLLNGFFPIRRCMRSGMCCQKGPCAFGDWDREAHRCRHLSVAKTGEGWTQYSCGIKDKIEALPPEAGAAANPAFGAGCCMPMFNPNREALVKHAVSEFEATNDE